MKRIPLTQGKHALVDDQDYDWLMTWRWHVITSKYTCYAGTSTKEDGLYCTLLMHRIVTMCPPRLEPDHLNHNGLDNRKENLAVGTRRMNQSNRNEKTSSKYVGVDWYKNTKKWRARIKVQGKSEHLGLFDNEHDAHIAYQIRLNQVIYS